MKEIRIENGSMYFERLIQVTKNPKGEQRAAEGGPEASITNKSWLVCVKSEKICLCILGPPQNPGVHD